MGISAAQHSILVFDSGVGGLSIVASLRAVRNDRALTYVCDNAAFPYGTKADDWLIERIVHVCDRAVKVTRASGLVVACNTASTLALGVLRRRLGIPVVGTVPAIKPAARQSRSGVIGLLATSATVNRPYTRRLIADFAQGVEVLRVAADELVVQAEILLRGEEPQREAIARAMAPLLDDARVDTVVLGCTHFPLLRPYFENLAPRPIQWIDSGAAVARRVGQVITNAAPHTGIDASLATNPQAAGLAHALAPYGFAAPRLLEA